MNLNFVDTTSASRGTVCRFVRTLLKQICICFIAEHIKLSGRLNTITIINCLTKGDLKILVSISIFGRLIRGKLKYYITKLS